VEGVDFGGVAATNVVVVSPFELTASPPPFSALNPSAACPVDNGASGQPLNPAQDVCQVEVTVTTAAGTSSTATILPPYEGPEEYDFQGGEILPTGCGCEDEPQTSEFDYVPAPTVTSVSTGTIADLPANAADLADEYGGSLVEVTGTGMDPLTFEYLLLGSPVNEDSIDYPVELSGTSLLLEAPTLPAVYSGAPTTEPTTLPVGLASLGGQSNQGSIAYAGVPEINMVTNTSNPRTLDGVYGAPATGGAPLDINGAGLLQAVGPIAFDDEFTGTSLGTQYNFTPTSDTDITTESVSQNPALVDTEVCSETGCNLPSSFNYPPSTADELIVYPPGAPDVTSVSPSSGPDEGGTAVEISGQNLGCVVSVKFGSVLAESFSNEQALLLCGTTGVIDATTPPGTPDTVVPVTVTTAESILTGDSPKSTASYSYTGLPGSPVIRSADSATAQVGSSFAFVVTATGKPTIKFSESGPLPQGLSFKTQLGSSTLIHGTPGSGTGGVYYFTITATNAIGTTSQVFTLTVNQAPVIQSPSVWHVVTGAPVSLLVTTSAYPLAIDSVSGTLPPGLSAGPGFVDGAMLISGTAEPGSNGVYQLTITAENPIGTTNKNLVIVVGGPA
jgi:hypothetical protein